MATYSRNKVPGVIFAEVLRDDQNDDFYIVLDLANGTSLLCPHSFATKGAANNYLHRNEHFLGRKADSFDSGWSYLVAPEAR